MIGVVIIGRNEGERLRRCLASAAVCGGPVVYVDSGSTDESVVVADAAGAVVARLDMSSPFSAARARNAGLKVLIDLYPDIRYAQFVDGDCELVKDWTERAVQELDARSELAAVCGRLREKFPDASVYNRLCDLEWDGPIGEVRTCGGIAMFRVAAFQHVGGFDPTVTAGEEPELCMRLRAKGWKIVRLKEEMALHDAAMLRFVQWWKRQVRGGYGAMDVVHRFDPDRRTAFARQIRSARLWGLAWPLAVVSAGFAGAGLGSRGHGVLAAGIVMLLLPAQIGRLTMKTSRQGAGSRVAAAYGCLTMLSKWASLAGQWRYLRDRRAGRHARLIEHKPTPQVAPVAAGRASAV